MTDERDVISLFDDYAPDPLTTAEAARFDARIERRLRQRRLALVGGGLLFAAGALAAVAGSRGGPEPVPARVPVQIEVVEPEAPSTPAPRAVEPAAPGVPDAPAVSEAPDVLEAPTEELPAVPAAPERVDRGDVPWPLRRPSRQAEPEAVVPLLRTGAALPAGGGELARLAIDRQAPTLEPCVVDGREVTALVRFAVVSGAVERVEVTAGERKVEACVGRRVRRWKFDPGVSGRVELPIVLRDVRADPR